jgi:DNA-binding GntR family transcriptional regulator
LKDLGLVKKIKAIERIEDVDRLERSLQGNPRDLLLFYFLAHLGLKLKDVLRLRVKDLEGLSEGDFIPTYGSLSDSKQTPIMTRQIQKAYNLLVRYNQPHSDDFLIKSQKGNSPLAMPSVSRLVKRWFKQVNLDGLVGVKSLRKTWEYHFNTPRQFENKLQQANDKRLFGDVVAFKIGDQVYSRLLDLILTGKLVPGTRLIARRIAEEMKISPMPVRDALNRLAANGIVNLEANRSYYVNALSKEELIEITELRMILEPMAAVDASRSINARDIKGIGKLGDDFRRAVEKEARATFVQKNRDFHFRLYGYAKNQKLIDIINQLWNSLSPYEYLLSEGSRSYNFKKGGYTNHRKIVSALRNKDHAALENWIKRNIEFAFDGIMAEFFK